MILNGFSLAVGSYVQIVGSGNCGTSFTATAINFIAPPTPAPTPTPTISPILHVMTAAYCCHGYANDTPAPSVAAPYVTYGANVDARVWRVR